MCRFYMELRYSLWSSLWCLEKGVCNSIMGPVVAGYMVVVWPRELGAVAPWPGTGRSKSQLWPQRVVWEQQQ